MVLEL
ncbi:Putative uncharacterized protein [Lacticaseibacillus paracasei]|jgi:hypothetical protein